METVRVSSKGQIVIPRVPLFCYVDPAPAEWPEADFIVGNPLFIGASGMRFALGDGYVEALRGAWPGMPESADLVMYWWHKAASLLAAGRVQRFGFITTNSLRQTFNRRVVERHLDALHLSFAIPDHPWADGSDVAGVRIAMTVGVAGTGVGRLLTVTDERASGGEGLEVTFGERSGLIHADLSIGANVAAAQALQANGGISSPGFKLHGAGFIVTPEDAARLEADAPLKLYRNGKDLTDRPRGVLLIDLYGHDADEVRRRWPATYQRVLERVKPERDYNNRAS